MVWEKVVQQLVDIGCFEVFVFMMVGYNGGLVLGIWFLFLVVLVDYVECQFDELGWEISYIVGNLLGGWVVFEFE